MLSTRIFGLACGRRVCLPDGQPAAILTWWSPGESGVVRMFHGGSAFKAHINRGA
jgi:hypothetical protein